MTRPRPIASGPSRGGVPPNWQVYVRVASADEAAQERRHSAEASCSRPSTSPTPGRMAVLQDPTGVFAVWEARRNTGSA